MKRAAQAFHSLAWRERRRDTDGFPNTRNGQIGPLAHVEAAAQLSENHGPAVARRLTDPGERRENDRRVPLQLAIIACLHFQRGPLFTVRRRLSLFVGDVREDAVGVPRLRSRGIENLPEGQRLRGQLSSLGEATLPVEQGGKVVQAASQLSGISDLAIDLERLPIPLFRVSGLPAS